MKKIVYGLLVALTVQSTAMGFFFWKRAAAKKAPEPVVPAKVAPAASPVLPPISPAELTHAMNFGEARSAVMRGDMSTLIYYLEAGLLRPSDYKPLLQEANFAVARRSKSWRSLGSWIKLFGGVTMGLIFLYNLYDALRMADEDQDEQSKKDITKEIESLNEDLNGVSRSNQHGVKAGVKQAWGGWSWADGLIEKRRTAIENRDNYKKNADNYGPNGSWGYSKYYHEMYQGYTKQEKAKIRNFDEQIREAERERKRLQNVLDDPKNEKSQDELLSRRWSLADYGGYLLGAGISFYIGYSGLVAPGKTYQEAKDIVELLKRYQRKACPQPEVARRPLDNDESDNY